MAILPASWPLESPPGPICMSSTLIAWPTSPASCNNRLGSPKDGSDGLSRNQRPWIQTPIPTDGPWVRQRNQRNLRTLASQHHICHPPSKTYSHHLIVQLSNAPSQIWLDGSRDHQPCIFKMLVARSRTERTSLSLISSFTHTFIRQILHQSIAFILILLSSISITQFRQYNTNPIFIQQWLRPYRDRWPKLVQCHRAGFIRRPMWSEHAETSVQGVTGVSRDTERRRILCFFVWQSS